MRTTSEILNEIAILENAIRDAKKKFLEAEKWNTYFTSTWEKATSDVGVMFIRMTPEELSDLQERIAWTEREGWEQAWVAESVFAEIEALENELVSVRLAHVV